MNNTTSQEKQLVIVHYHDNEIIAYLKHEPRLLDTLIENAHEIEYAEIVDIELSEEN